MIDIYSLVVSKDKLLAFFGKKEFTSRYEWSYNIKPLDASYIITQEEPALIQRYVWGLLPSWSRHDENTGNLYNAKASSISTKPSFRIPIRQKRCIILAGSFYVSDSHHNFYRVFKRNNQVLCLAGIYDQWHDHDKQHNTFALITNQSNKELSRISSDSPVVLSEEEMEAWLNPQTRLSDAMSLLRMNPSNTLSMYRISNTIKDTSVNNPSLHEEIEISQTLFDL